ncbi:MAG: TetR/AcrR family transcriptional regulator [Halieaceae bacterium]|jgi:AcrR family transcriptional regulator|nr:TetR/AcrR family transcriptional regulator [Halieaceae bacterium]
MTVEATQTTSAPQSAVAGESAVGAPRARGATRSAKGARARANLKKAALVVLEREGLHRMRIADVTREAGVAQGLFYHYFKDLKSLTLEVLADFINPARDAAAIEKDVARGDWYGRIHAHNQLVVASYARRPGVMRCLLQLADDDAEFACALRDAYREQLMWLVDLMPRLFPNVRFKRHQALMTVYALAGIGEGLLREYFINESETLRASKLSEAELSELLTTMFYRALFLEHPPEDKLRYTRNLAAMRRAPEMD